MAFQNICGVSVVDHRFEELKRYNISEIFDPTPKEEAPKVEKGDEAAVKDEAVKDENTAETGKEAATDAKPTDDNSEGVSSAVKDEASSEANEAKTGQDDEGGVSAVQADVQASSAPDGSSGAP
jgi:tRNA acetyltransferase TAN1